LLVEVVLVTFWMICCKSAMLTPTSLASAVLLHYTLLTNSLDRI